MSNQGDIAQRSPSVATVDTPELVKLMSFWADSDPGPEALEKYQAVIAHIDAHVAAQVAEERLRADNADGMAECMRMFRDDMISAGIIGSDVPPMFMSEAILRVVAEKDAEIKTLKAALDAQGELTDRYQEIALSAQSAAPVSAIADVVKYTRLARGVQYPDNYQNGPWEDFYACDDVVRALVSSQPSPAPVAMTDGQIGTLRKLLACCEILDKRPRPMCRDCADECGTCPHDGLQCDMRKLFADARAILAAQQEAK